MRQCIKHYFLFSLILLLVLAAGGCHNTKPTSDATVTKADTATFMALFRELHFDSLYLTSEYDSVKNEKCFLHGLPLDSIYCSLFPDTIRNHAIVFNPGADEQFAVGRFFLDQYHDGYLIRHRVEDFPSWITLVVYDKKQARFLDENLLVAENWGDDGDATIISSTLINKGDKLEIWQHVSGSTSAPRDSTFNTLLEEASEEVYSLERGHIRKLSEVVLKYDTIDRGFNRVAPVDTAQKDVK